MLSFTLHYITYFIYKCIAFEIGSYCEVLLQFSDAKVFIPDFIFIKNNRITTLNNNNNKNKNSREIEPENCIKLVGNGKQ